MVLSVKKIVKSKQDNPNLRLTGTRHEVWQKYSDANVIRLRVQEAAMKDPHLILQLEKGMEFMAENKFQFLRHVQPASDVVGGAGGPSEASGYGNQFSDFMATQNRSWEQQQNTNKGLSAQMTV